MHTYWLKKLTGVHECLPAQMHQLLMMDGTQPNWFTKGRTVLIMKDPQKEAVASNYWPITYRFVGYQSIE